MEAGLGPPHLSRGLSRQSLALITMAQRAHIMGARRSDMQRMRLHHRTRFEGCSKAYWEVVPLTDLQLVKGAAAAPLGRSQRFTCSRLICH